MEYYIGVDLGTSSVKLLLLDGEGEVKKTAAREYPVRYPRPGWSEQDPADWWKGVCEGLKELLAGVDTLSVRALGVAGQMHGLVALDDQDRVIRPAILWNDGRTQKQTDELNTVVGTHTLFSRTGNVAFAGFTAPKLLWMKENEPQNFKRIRKILLPKDYLNFLLTGAYATDYSDGAGTLLLDVKNKCWSEPMRELCGIGEEVLPPLYESHQVIGCLREELAREFSLPAHTLVVAGAGDNAAAAVGTGTVGEGRCNLSLGTSGTVFVSSHRFGGDAAQAIHSFCHADGGYHLMGCILSAASCNKWVCDKILHLADYGAEGAAAHGPRPGTNEVFFLPYLMGERSPINDTDATGLFIGLRPDTDGAAMHQAVLEGVAFAIKDNLEIIRGFGIDVKESTLCGGGAASPFWRRILADVLDVELVLPQTEQGPGYGAALLAMVGAGRFADVGDCSRHFFRERERIRPDGERVRLYRQRYEQYRRIYPAVKQLYKELKA